VIFYFGYVCIWLWTTCIAVNLAYVVYQKPKAKQNQIPIQSLLGATVGSALTTTIILGAIGGLGRTITNGSGWCLIKNGEVVIYTIFATVPACGIFLTISMLYSAACIKLYRTVNDRSDKIPISSKNAYLRAIKKSIIFPFAFLFVWLFPVMWTIWFNIGGEPEWLTMMAILGVNLSGTVNSIAYFCVHHVMIMMDPDHKSVGSNSADITSTRLPMNSSTRQGSFVNSRDSTEMPPSVN